MDVTTSPTIQNNYDENANAYNQFLKTPLGTLEQQLFTLSITNCDGYKVLDLGGGTGLRARDALDAGAHSVDVIDISPSMMAMGQEYEKSVSRNAINWYQTDVSKPLDHLDLQHSLGPYDMVIANGIFDHAQNPTELEMMWSNAAKYLKPGGRLVANRNNPLSSAAKHGKYGVTLADFRDIPGGLSFKYRMATMPPLEFESVALDVYYSGNLDIPGKFFEGFENVPWEETEVVKQDPEFWQEYLNDPILYIFTARKYG